MIINNARQAKKKCMRDAHMTGKRLRAVLKRGRRGVLGTI